MKTVEVKNRAEWREWLATYHDREVEIWLVYYKKKSGKASVDYNASVEEALCYGWIDSIIKKLDDTKYARKFTQRAEVLRKNKEAQETFENLAPTYPKQYLGWIEAAKRPETKQKRIEESIRLFAVGKKLGLK